MTGASLRAKPVSKVLLCFALVAGLYAGSLSKCALKGSQVTARVTIKHQNVGFLQSLKSVGGLLGQDQALTTTQSCWRCIKPGWRKHFLFANSSTWRLDACPDSSSWPAGTWYQTQKSATSQQNITTTRDSTGNHRQEARPAQPGEAAVLPGTALAQQALWATQHPADCSAAKFVVYHAVASGIGSVVHVETGAMAAAMETGRVFLEAPGNFLTKSAYCGGSTTLDSCYFEPLSNCTLAMAGITPQEVAAAPKLTSAQLREFAASNQSSPRVVVMSVAEASSVRDFCPNMFMGPLDAAMVPRARRFWWWRAQAVTYIVRPNARSLLEIAARKKAKLRGSPLQDGCISLHVRHGDKATENQIWDDTAYEAAAMQLRDIDSTLIGQLFLSTEDPKTVEFFQTSSRNWNTTVVDMKRKPDPKVSNLNYMAQHGYSEEMLDCLVSLDLALTCDGFVGSFYSNWARLIEEMRSVVRCKAQRVFYDVGGEELMNRPGGLDLNW